MTNVEKHAQKALVLKSSKNVDDSLNYCCWGDGKFSVLRALSHIILSPNSGSSLVAVQFEWPQNITHTSKQGASQIFP